MGPLFCLTQNVTISENREHTSRSTKARALIDGMSSTLKQGGRMRSSSMGTCSMRTWPSSKTRIFRPYRDRQIVNAFQRSPLRSPRGPTEAPTGAPFP